jgi:hypothetical protein
MKRTHVLCFLSYILHIVIIRVILYSISVGYTYVRSIFEQTRQLSKRYFPDSETYLPAITLIPVSSTVIIWVGLFRFLTFHQIQKFFKHLMR